MDHMIQNSLLRGFKNHMAKKPELNTDKFGFKQAHTVWAILTIQFSVEQVGLGRNDL